MLQAVGNGADIVILKKKCKNFNDVAVFASLKITK